MKDAYNYFDREGNLSSSEADKEYNLSDSDADRDFFFVALVAG